MIELLERASASHLTPWVVRCQVFTPEWCTFVQDWASRIHPFVETLFGPYGTEPHTVIEALPVSAKAIGASASFDMSSGQITLCPSMEGDPGRTLEKLTHELLHGSFSDFPSVDPFYDEGFVDYTTLLLSSAPIYRDLGPAMQKSALGNIERRRQKGLAAGSSDYDRKRAMGAIFAKMAYGTQVVAHLRTQKMNRTFQW